MIPTQGIGNHGTQRISHWHAGNGAQPLYVGSAVSYAVVAYIIVCVGASSVLLQMVIHLTLNIFPQDETQRSLCGKDQVHVGGSCPDSLGIRAYPSWILWI